ncbi:hypothetical protein [uncultured Dokdonia sp.]|uniref:hypothetical protein n=1 Tax=uncultured Dokdonia sp. TaxID=575653 RepID=UPI0026105301|nr:hypothetical protein [uncultured Dokdonia sp.]
MNTQSTTTNCNPVIVPDGYILLTKGPNTPKNNAGTSNPIEIQFDNNRSKRPLPPLVEADYTIVNNGNGVNTITINVSAIVFINVESKDCIEENPILVYWNNNYASPMFYIAYNAAEMRSNSFYAYEVSFEIHHGATVVNPAIPEITTFLVDEDPITSKGTKTTVQPST